MAVVLYGSKSSASFVVHWLLIELGIEHELRMLDLEQGEQKSPAYLALNPQGRVPTLVVDGQVLTESAAIVMHLADLHPDAALAPAPGTPQRAAYYRWMFFCAYTLMPAYRRWFYPHEPAGQGQVPLVQAQALAELEAAWRQVDEHLRTDGPWLLGAQRSAADFVLTMLMRWSRNMPRPADSLPGLAAHARAMKALPSFAEAYRREGLTDWT